MISLPFNKKIGTKEPMFIVAEVGSNWATKEDCLSSIRQAKVYGANAVKFQLYDEYSFYYREQKRDGSLPKEWLPELKTEADKHEIEFMCSAFSPELLKTVDQYVNIHKVASAEMCHVEMLEFLASKKKPVILSTGGHGYNEIKQALAILKDVEVVLMYCIASYPAKHTNLNKITKMQKTYGRPVGLSDHSLENFSVPEMADKLVAAVLEKHVNFTGILSPDSPHSLSGREFKNMCEHLKSPYNTLEGHDPEEIDMVLKHHRRLIAKADIKEGETLKYGWNFGIYRSLEVDTHGYSPFMTYFVNGKTASKEIKAGKSIGPGDY